MGLPSLDIDFHASSMHTVNEGDGAGPGEPYLWPIFFKIDRDSVHTSSGDAAKLAGEPVFHFGAGSHDNLIGTPVVQGQPILIPELVGRWQTTLRSLRLDNPFDDTELELPGIVVGIFVLMEENTVTDEAIEIGHQKLNEFAQQSIVSFLQSLNVAELLFSAQVKANSDGIPIEKALEAILLEQFTALAASLKEDAVAILTGAISENQTIFENIASFFTGDDLIDAEFVVFNSAALGENLGEPTDFDLSLAVEGVFPQGGGFGDGEPSYTLHGQIRATRRLDPIKDNQLPAAERLEVSCVRTGFSKAHRTRFIEAIGGTFDGVPWRCKRGIAIELIKTGMKTFFTRAPDGGETEIRVHFDPAIGHEFLATDPNESLADNLLSLPFCPSGFED